MPGSKTYSGVRKTRETKASSQSLGPLANIPEDTELIVTEFEDLFKIEDPDMLKKELENYTEAGKKQIFNSYRKYFNKNLSTNQQGIRANKTSKETLLTRAIDCNNIALAKELLEMGADPRISRICIEKYYHKNEPKKVLNKREEKLLPSKLVEQKLEEEKKEIDKRATISFQEKQIAAGKTFDEMCKNLKTEVPLEIENMRKTSPRFFTREYSLSELLKTIEEKVNELNKSEHSHANNIVKQRSGSPPLSGRSR